MSTATHPPVAADPRHTVTVECCTCDLQLQLLPGRDLADALRAFRTAHPMTATERHASRVPTGWQRPLSGRGALSQ